MGEVEQLGHRQQVVRIEAVGLLPAILALLVAAAGDDAVPGAFLAGIAPDGDLQNAEADLVCWFRHGGGLLHLVSGLANRGLTARPKKPASPGASSRPVNRKIGGDPKGGTDFLI